MLKTSLASVLEPKSESVAPPLMVTTFDGSIWPALPVMVTLVFVMVRPPAGMTTTPALPLSVAPWVAAPVSQPWKTVPPV